MVNEQQLLKRLVDREVLGEAYAASSAYVMRKAFEANKALAPFKGRADLAPAIIKQFERQRTKRPDWVVLSAHLYALQLTGADRETRNAVKVVLRDKVLKADPMVGQFAAHVGNNLVKYKKRVPAGHYYAAEEVKGILGGLQRKEG